MPAAEPTVGLSSKPQHLALVDGDLRDAGLLLLLGNIDGEHTTIKLGGKPGRRGILEVDPTARLPLRGFLVQVVLALVLLALLSTEMDRRPSLSSTSISSRLTPASSAVTTYLSPASSTFILKLPSLLSTESGAEKNESSGSNALRSALSYLSYGTMFAILITPLWYVAPRACAFVYAHIYSPWAQSYTYKTKIFLLMRA